MFQIRLFGSQKLQPQSGIAKESENRNITYSIGKSQELEGDTNYDRKQQNADVHPLPNIIPAKYRQGVEDYPYNNR
ncbi:hypothetical protein D3C73_1506200 [compost metagenome]